MTTPGSGSGSPANQREQQRHRQRTRLVVEERGLPVGQAHFYRAGWQVHLEDLRRSLAADGPAHIDGWSEHAAAPAWHERWTELTPAYQDLTVHRGWSH